MIIKIHPIFHISLLKLVLLKIPEGPTPIFKERISEAEYKIKRIINIAKRRNRLL
jgi:hypothetical protein